ncbi:hypothetical protein ACFL1X_13990, partial [Candidatus Hydrogenedentota bacterium]
MRFYKTSLVITSCVFLLHGKSAEAIRGSYGDRSPAGVILGLDEPESIRRKQSTNWGGGMMKPKGLEETLIRSFMAVGPQPDFIEHLQMLVAQESHLGGVFPRYAYMAIPENAVEFAKNKSKTFMQSEWQKYLDENKDKVSPLELYRFSRTGRALARILWQEYFNILLTDPRKWGDTDARFGMVRGATRLAGNVASLEADHYYGKVVKMLSGMLEKETRAHGSNKTP